MKKLGMAASARGMSVASGHWFLCVSVLKSWHYNVSELTQECLEPCFPLSWQSRGPPRCPALTAGDQQAGRQELMGLVFLFVANPIYRKCPHTIFHKL